MRSLAKESTSWLSALLGSSMDKSLKGCFFSEAVHNSLRFSQVASSSCVLAPFEWLTWGEKWWVLGIKQWWIVSFGLCFLALLGSVQYIFLVFLCKFTGRLSNVIAISLRPTETSRLGSPATLQEWSSFLLEPSWITAADEKEVRKGDHQKSRWDHHNMCHQTGSQ